VEGYRIELPTERLTADFSDDSILELTPDLVGATETQNSGIIGAPVNLTLAHTGDVRPSQVLYELTTHLLMTKWRDAGEDPKLYLFGQLKRIAKQWLDGYLVCKGGTYPAQLKYKMLADMAANRITAAITRQFLGDRPIKALLDPYNHTGSTRHVRFNTSRADRWDTKGPPPKNHVNWVVLDSDWEAEFCRVAEQHPKVIAYTKNHNLGLEVPYRYGSETRKYLPDFIILVDDGLGHDDPLHLVTEIKGYRREDAKEKKATMDTYWVPGVNHLGSYGRWAFAEFTDIYQIQSDFNAKIEFEFAKMIETTSGRRFSPLTPARNRAETFVVRQFGRQSNLIEFNRIIWERIISNGEHAVYLADVLAAAADASCGAEEALSVLALLSSRSIGLLEMIMNSTSLNGGVISWPVFIQKLSEWWRDRTISDADWERWSSGIEVRWTPATSGERII
jgi:Endonuclease domain